MEYKMVRVPEDLHSRLNHRKIHDRQPLWEIIDGLEKKDKRTE
jgi:hypothetical protein